MLHQRITHRKDQVWNQDALQPSPVKAPDRSFLNREDKTTAGEKEEEIDAREPDVFDEGFQPAEHGHAAKHGKPDMEHVDP